MTLEMMEIEYNRARDLMNKDDLESVNEALKTFDNLGDYKDSLRFKNETIKRINILKDDLAQKNEEDYNRALMLMENKKSAQRLDQAIKLFNDLGDYKDSINLKKECEETRIKVMKADKKGLDRLKLTGYIFAGIGVVMIVFIICAVIWSVISNGGE